MGSQSEILDPLLNNVFLFSTEIWTEQLKNHPVQSTICGESHKRREGHMVKSINFDALCLFNYGF